MQANDEQSVLFLGRNTFCGRDEEEISDTCRAEKLAYCLVVREWTIPR